MAGLPGVKRVLVTGATGCVGRHVLPRLEADGWDVHAVASRQAPYEAGRTTWHQADLLDPAATAEVVRRAEASHLLHLAWYIAPGRWAAAPDNLAWVEASLGLFRRFREAGGTRVVGAGSCLEYDWQYGYCSEARTPTTPHTLYGTCKNALRLLADAMSADDGFTTAWGRIFFLYGPWEHPDRLVPSVIRALIAGEPARCSHGRQVRDYLHADDVADVFVRLLASDVTGPVNVASGQAVALREIVTRIGERIGRPDLIRLGAIPPAPTDTPLVVADTTRLAAALDWRPAIDLDAGLDRTIAWWRAHQAAGPARSGA
ncbi:MAG: NAD(P)-dependent oxidoreductase [Vicinamibacterales bacterium]